MKKFILLFASVLVSACASTNVVSRAVQVRTLQNSGYKVCSSDLDCVVGTYCGFVSVDSVPVCKTGFSDSSDLQR